MHIRFDGALDSCKYSIFYMFIVLDVICVCDWKWCTDRHRSIIAIVCVISFFSVADEVDTQFCVCSKAADADQATKSDVQNTGSPSVLDTKRINRYPHLQPLDMCYDDLCDPYTYQVRITVYF